MYEISTINITGADACEFLQGQLTNDLARLESGREMRAAWCNPKGRVIWFGSVRSIDGRYALAVPADRAGDIVKRLTMYRFRSKVDFEIGRDREAEDAAARITAGVPWIGEAQSEQFTPHMLNLDLLGAVSFDKGCYTGQEIVARTYYKGATKRRTLRFASDAPVEVGDKVSLDGRDVGEVLNVAGNELLAVVALDKAGENLVVGEVPLTRLPLPYLE